MGLRTRQQGVVHVPDESISDTFTNGSVDVDHIDSTSISQLQLKGQTIGFLLRFNASSFHTFSDLIELLSGLLEVTLDDSQSLGVNWSRVSEVLDSGVNVDSSSVHILRHTGAVNAHRTRSRCWSN